MAAGRWVSRRRLTALMAAVGATAVAGGCGSATDRVTSGVDPEARRPTPDPAGGPSRGGTLVIGADADPIGLDPTTTGAFSSYDFVALIYNGLFRWNADMEIEPDLAESYDQVDDTRYVFHLRKGVTFHNGQPFTAADVKFTFDRILDPDTAAPRQAQFATIDEITVLDDHTVQFDLSTPDAAILSFLASVPDGAIIPQGVADLDTNPIGTGPYRFASYRPNLDLHLEANPDFYVPELPHLAAVVFRFFRDQSSLTSALRSRAVDMTWFKDPKVAANVVRASSDIVSAPGQVSRVFPVWLTRQGPLEDVRVRRAMSVSIDRGSIVNTVLAGSGLPGAFVPKEQLGGYDGESPLPYYEHDLDQARQLLTEAGYPDGVDLGDYKVVAANALDVQASQILQRQWSEAGIRVNLLPMETAPLLEQWRSGDFGLLSVSKTSSAWDPDQAVNYFASSNQLAQAMGLSDPELDRMIADARAELDPAERGRRYLDIQRHIADQAYVLSIYQYPLRWEAWWNYAKDYEALPTNIRTYVRDTWLDL